MKDGGLNPRYHFLYRPKAVALSQPGVTRVRIPVTGETGEAYLRRLSVFIPRRGGPFRAGLCRLPFNAALLRLAPAPCPASKIPHRFG